MNKLKEIFNLELKYLEDAIKNSKNPYHTFSLSSIGNKFPENRTIVLRAVQLDPFKIFFNSDYRSPKRKELVENNSCTALFYDCNRRIQLRIKCKAVIHYQNNIAKRIWNNTPLQSRKCYMGPYAPSDNLDDWHPNIPLEYLKNDPDAIHSEDGYINFTHIELDIVQTDILQLHHDGHIRFKVKNNNTMHYIAP